MTRTTEALAHQDLFIAGQHRSASGDRAFDDISPVTGLVIRTVSAASTDDAMTAVEAARDAVAGWAGRSYVERRSVLLAAADILEFELDATAELIALETGGTRGWAEMNVHESASTLREAAGLASSASGELFPSHDPRTVNFSLRQPAGVVLAVIPWNAPLILSARATAIALAMGNTVVFRPSEEAPTAAASILADALHRAGIPAGVVNVVTTAPADGPEVITALVRHPAVRRVVFIGSTRVGRSIASLAGQELTPAVMELGGKNSTIIRGDADVAAWVPTLAFSAFANTGQVCMCSERIIAHRSIADEVAAQLGAFAATMKVGDPRLHETQVGPVINQRSADNFSAIVDDAVGNGATVVSGGTIDGLLARPTVLTGVTAACRFYLEESFLPIVSVIAADDDEHALELANEGAYGLIASVISADRSAAEDLARRVAAGAVHVNGASVGDEPHVPFGGVGASGFGRLGGAESARFFTEQRTIYRHG